MCCGSELTSNAILAWADAARVEWHYIAPGKPMQNGFIERTQGWIKTGGNVIVAVGSGFVGDAMVSGAGGR
jgi:transposase InsO family protein